VPHICYVCAMAPRKEYEWEVIRLQVTPAKFIGYVHAPHEETARARRVRARAIHRAAVR
jgi:hypothetical protein